MKNLKYLILILAFISCKKEMSSLKFKPSKIDSLNSKNDIENFIAKNDTTLSGFKLKRVQDFGANKFADSVGANKSFYKADFDNNKFQDLFVIGDFRNSKLMYSFAFMNYGDSIKTVWMKDRSSFIIPKVVRENNQDYLEIYWPNYQNENSKIITETDKLIFKYGGFINYNSKPKKYSIDKIEFTAFDIRGEYEIIINSNLNSSFKLTKGYYDKNIVTKTEAKLTQKEYNDIVDLLNYMDFVSLKDGYFVQGTDMPQCNLKIAYNGKEIKKISDYGMEQNYSLVQLYKKLEKLKSKNLKK